MASAAQASGCAGTETVGSQSSSGRMGYPSPCPDA